jgi:hypothetical protein
VIGLRGRDWAGRRFIPGILVSRRKSRNGRDDDSVTGEGG